MPECIKEALNPNDMTMKDMIDDDNLLPPSVFLVDLPPDQTVHHQDEDTLLATDD